MSTTINGATTAPTANNTSRDVALPVKPGETKAALSGSKPEVEIISNFPMPLCLRPHNDREDRDEAEMLRLTASIEAHGVLQTTTAVAEVIDGVEYARFIDGWSRVLCSARARKPTIPVRLFRRALTPTEELVLTWTGNMSRTTTSHKDRLTWLCKLAELNPEWTQAEVAAAFGLTPGEVSKMFSISKRMPADLQEKIGTRPGMIAPRGAYALAGLDDEPKMRELAARVMDGTLKIEALETLVANFKGGKAKKKAAKDVKARTPRGVQVIIPDLDCQAVLDELKHLNDAVAWAQKEGMPLSSVQGRIDRQKKAKPAQAGA